MQTRHAFLLILGMILAGAVHAKAQAKGDKALGEYLASECVACHQVSGKSTGSIPPIVGLPESHIGMALSEYKNKTRKHDAMNVIASRLSQEDIDALAAYFASIKQ